MANLLLTGIPRSGTTLASALIDGLPDAVCLNEPGWQVAKPYASAHAFAAAIAADFDRLRGDLRAGRPVLDRRAPDGSAVTNYYTTDATTRRMRTTFDVVPIIRPNLSEDFTLAIKHNGPYLAALKPLIEIKKFTIIVIIRHPLPVLASWRALDLPISRGEMPGAAPYWPKLAGLMAEPIELLEKQVRIYDLFCRRIYNLRDHVHILPYETLVKQPGKLVEMAGLNGRIESGLITKPERVLPEQEAEAMRRMLKRYNEFWPYFYSENTL